MTAGWADMRRGDFDQDSPYALCPELDPITDHTRWAPDLPPPVRNLPGQHDLFGNPPPAPKPARQPKPASSPSPAQGDLFSEE